MLQSRPTRRLATYTQLGNRSRLLIKTRIEQIASVSRSNGYSTREEGEEGGQKRYVSVALGRRTTLLRGRNLHILDEVRWRGLYEMSERCTPVSGPPTSF